jgi:hypothetical protein
MNTQSVLMLVAWMIFLSTTRGKASLSRFVYSYGRDTKVRILPGLVVLKGCCRRYFSCRLYRCVVGQAALTLQGIVMPQATQEPLAQ